MQRSDNERTLHETTREQGMVAAPPRFKAPIQPQVQRPGETCRLEARLSGAPWPEVTWTKDARPLVLDARRHVIVVDAARGEVSLLIRDLVAGDTGDYKCEARNAAGRASCTANVVVVRK